MRTAFRRTRRRHGDAHPRGEDQHGRLALRLLLQRSHQVAHPAGTPCRYIRGDGGHGRNVRLQEHMVTAESPRQDRVTDGNAQRADRQGIGSLEASQPDAPRDPCERLCWGRTLSASPPKVVPLRRRPGKWPGLFSLKDESRHRGTGRCNVDIPQLELGRVLIFRFVCVRHLSASSDTTAYYELRGSAARKHNPELLHLLLDHLCWGLLVNERVGATEPIPEIVDLMGLLADKSCGGRRAFALLQALAKRLLFRGEGHCINACGGLCPTETRMEAHRNA
jgi:hypothetical protein